MTRVGILYTGMALVVAGCGGTVSLQDSGTQPHGGADAGTKGTPDGGDAAAADAGSGPEDSGQPGTDAGNNWAWTSSQPLATWSDGNWEFQNDMWNCSNGGCGAQEIEVNNQSDWAAVSNQASGNTAVLTYPDVQVLFSDKALSGFSSITSSFTESMPQASSGMIGEAAYDIWLNNWKNEVMIWVDTQNENPGSYLQTVDHLSIAGQSFTVYQNNSEIICLLSGNETTGNIDIKTTLTDLENDGVIPANSTLTAVDFGWEICSTGGVAQTFRISNYTLDAP